MKKILPWIGFFLAIALAFGDYEIDRQFPRSVINIYGDVATDLAIAVCFLVMIANDLRRGKQRQSDKN